ncbi:complement factor H-like isoform X2 [Mixophyes fleayi]|uniref:complement factor H-like isoform X2 n=1 Tax=Mixophyes fleayi TaxID=3061075 RepID=UPI003F4D830B
MSLLGFLLLLTSVLSCKAAPTLEKDLGCSAPPRMTEAALDGDWNDDTYPTAKIATYSCRPGYNILESIRMVCIDGQWEFIGKRGRCIKKSCGHPGNIPFGTFQLKNEVEFVFGAVVEYSCDEGYQMASSEKTRECNATGWSNFPPRCEGTCSLPMIIKGKVSEPKLTDYKENQLVQFTCDHGFKASRNGETTCTKAGWRPTPSCDEITCSLPLINKGKVSNPKLTDYKENELLQFTCDHGLKASRNGDSTCTIAGWSPTPSCDEITCDPYRQVVNGNLTKDKDVYREGDRITLVCNYHYTIQHSPNEPRVCTSNGWSPSLNCIRKCNYREAVLDNANSHLYPTQHAYVEGDKIQFICNGDFKTADGTDRGWMICLHNGKFSPSKCSKTCSITALQNGNYQPNKSEFEIGEYLRYECNDGFTTPNGKFVGSSQCLISGWSSDLKCIDGNSARRDPTSPEDPVENPESKLCKNPLVIKNGELTEDSKQEFYNTDNIVRYRCNPGFQISESDESICVDGQWTAPPICTEKSCGNAPSVENAVIQGEKTDFNNGENAIYQCKNDFTFAGGSIAECIEGKWLNIPTCIKTGTSCGPLPDVQFGETKDTRSTVYESGSYVEYKCPTYYVLEGSSRVTCMNGVWSEAPVCLEPCTVTRKDMNENNIQMILINQDKLYAQHGDVIMFTCKNGYVFSPGTNMIGKCDRGVMQYPKCFEKA